MKSHYQVLDGLRGTAALSVFIFHIWEVLAYKHNPMPHTFLAVDFFFTLSGFVLGHAYDARRAAPSCEREAMSLSSFLKRRLIRLHPMVMISMIIGITAYLLDPFVGEAQRVGTSVSLGTLLMTFALSLLLLPTAPLPNSFGETHTMNGPSWTLFQEYIANILYGLFGHKMGLRLHLFLCLMSAAALLLTALHFGDLNRGWGWNDYWVAPIRLACPFLMGLLVFRLKLHTKIGLKLPQPFLILSLVLLGIFFTPVMGSFNALFEAGCVILLFPAILAAGAAAFEIKGQTGRDLCRFMGDISYPLYIVHYPFIYLLAHWDWTLHPNRLQVSVAVLGLCLGVITLAYGLMRWYDAPLRALLAKKVLTTR